LTVTHVYQCIGPEMRTDITAVTATSTIATSNGTIWVAPCGRGEMVRFTIVGIVVVLMAFLSFQAKGSGAGLSRDPPDRIDPDQT
jgi:hypothetical protein